MRKPALDFAATVAEVSALIATLRRALRDALDCVLPELSGARACGRALGLKHNLGWKVYTVATSTDTPTVLRLLPRRAGWTLVLKGLREAKCPEHRLGSLAAAVDRLAEHLDEAHLDRALLRAVAAGGLDNARESLATTRARKAARESNERIYGVRAEAILGTYLIGPPDAHHHVGVFGIVHYEGLRRLRPGPAVPVHRSMQMWHPAWNGVRPGRGTGPGRVPSLVTDLSDPTLDAGLLRAVERAPGSVVEYLGDGHEPPRGFRAVFADFAPQGGTVGQADDRADLELGVHFPMAHALLEIWIHRSIRRHSEPDASLFGSSRLELGDDLDLLRLPLEATVESIASPALPSALAGARRAHRTMVDRGAARLGRPLAEFEGFRVLVPDPPTSGRVMLKWRM